MVWGFIISIKSYTFWLLYENNQDPVIGLLKHPKYFNCEVVRMTLNGV